MQYVVVGVFTLLFILAKSQSFSFNDSAAGQILGLLGMAAILIWVPLRQSLRKLLRNSLQVLGACLFMA